MQKFVKIGSKEVKNEKIVQKDREVDAGQNRIRKAHQRAQVSSKLNILQNCTFSLIQLSLSASMGNREVLYAPLPPIPNVLIF